MSSFIVVNLILGAAALLLVLPLRPQTGSTAKLLLGLAAGALLGILAIDGVTAALHTSRDSNIRPIVKYVTDTADPAKLQLLLVGSSYSALGVDGKLIERDLARAGIALQVLDLAKPGNFMISQDYTIDYYLARAKKVPEFIFIELGPEYYNDPGAMGPSYVNTGTAISDHTADQVPWRVRSIGAYDAPPGEKFSKYRDLATHVLFHYTDFGLSGQLVAERDLSGAPGFSPEETPHVPVKPSELTELAQAPAPPPPGALPANVEFIAKFREMQVRKLKARGAKVVGFYQTAMAPLGMRDYGVQLCAQLHGIPCITANDPALRRKLNNPSLWFDPVHLLHPGAEIYSAWFANQLASTLAPYRRGAQ